MNGRRIAMTPSAYAYPLLIKQLLHAPLEGILFVRNNPAIRGLVGWRAYMCAPARARRTYASRRPGRGAFFACRGLSFLKARRNR
jgi:hypothetical protein